MHLTPSSGFLLDDLLYIEGMRDYRRIFARDKQILTLQTFGELEQAIRKLFCNC